MPSLMSVDKLQEAEEQVAQMREEAARAVLGGRRPDRSATGGGGYWDSDLRRLP